MGVRIMDKTMSNNVWQVANINGYKVKYCFKDRHYYLLSPASNAWERMSLKHIAGIINAEATFISNEVKHAKAYEPWQESRERKATETHPKEDKMVMQWETLMTAIRGTRTSLNMAVSQFSKDTIKRRLCYLVSQAWYVGRCLQMADAEIKERLANDNACQKERK